MNTIETLRAARELLSQPDTWGQGEYVWAGDDGRVRYCLLGAVGLRNDWTIEQFTAAEPVTELLTDVVQEKHHTDSPWRFNDAPDTTLADILIVLDLAIDRAVGES